MQPLLLAIIQETGGGDAPAGGCGQGGTTSMMMIAMMFAVFYFILIRPQQKRQKQHQALLSALKKGDQVVTRGGLVGRVSGVDDKHVILQVQEKVRIRIVRSYIDSKITTPTKSADAKVEVSAAKN